MHTPFASYSSVLNPSIFERLPSLTQACLAYNSIRFLIVPISLSRKLQENLTLIVVARYEFSHCLERALACFCPNCEVNWSILDGGESFASKRT
jgi:hypothetical protein